MLITKRDADAAAARGEQLRPWQVEDEEPTSREGDVIGPLEDCEESDTSPLISPVMPNRFARSYRERLQRELDERPLIPSPSTPRPAV